ncbi:MAG: ATP-binding cassette domain-containing protein [Chloroflexota bacterium]|nr:ATP-binding cassette domain-containing protein [Chloroflexota bacterium]
MPIIEAKGLTKRFRRPVKPPGLGGALRHLVRPRYQDVTAVDGIDLHIEAGERVAYVGPNGAGKSTTVKLLTGILVPSAGYVQVRGVVPAADRIANARNIGVVFGQRTQLWWDIPVREAFRLLGDIYEVPDARFRTTYGELVDVLNLEPLLSVPARQLSLGQRMRCDLAASLLHGPAVLYLDEPTIGLDVAVKARFREFIQTVHARQGLTVLLTSHDLGDIEQLCERMVMIDRGRIVYDGPFAEITRRFGYERAIHFQLTKPLLQPGDTVRRALGDRAPVNVAVADADDLSLSLTFDGRDISAGELIRELATSIPFADVRIEEPTAESIIRKLYEGTLTFDAVSDGHLSEPDEQRNPAPNQRSRA